MVTLSRMDCEVMSWIVHLLVLHGFCGVCCGIWIAFGTSCVAFVVGIENGLLDVWHGLCTRYTTIFWVCCCMDCGLIV